MQERLAGFRQGLERLGWSAPATAAFQHVHNAADNAAIVHPLDTPDICRQVTFNSLPFAHRSAKTGSDARSQDSANAALASNREAEVGLAALTPSVHLQNF